MVALFIYLFPPISYRHNCLNTTFLPYSLYLFLHLIITNFFVHIICYLFVFKSRFECKVTSKLSYYFHYSYVYIYLHYYEKLKNKSSYSIKYNNRFHNLNHSNFLYLKDIKIYYIGSFIFSDLEPEIVLFG
uniref:Uncharacterized protein n=1 Tax=Heterorhabditis bacteriophora TaxID=37862 RepID=A0A1I7X1J7_HETBA